MLSNLVQKTPKSDLRFMVNELNLYTCADSSTALLEFIQYIVNDGDMVERNDQGDVTPTATEEAPQFPSVSAFLCLQIAGLLQYDFN